MPLALITPRACCLRSVLTRGRVSLGVCVRCALSALNLGLIGLWLVLLLLATLSPRTAPVADTVEVRGLHTCLSLLRVLLLRPVPVRLCPFGCARSVNLLWGIGPAEGLQLEHADVDGHRRDRRVNIWAGHAVGGSGHDEA